jgi:hypothetical protein
MRLFLYVCCAVYVAALRRADLPSELLPSVCKWEQTRINPSKKEVLNTLTYEIYDDYLAIFIVYIIDAITSPDFIQS